MPRLLGTLCIPSIADYNGGKGSWQRGRLFETPLDGSQGLLSPSQTKSKVKMIYRHDHLYNHSQGLPDRNSIILFSHGSHLNEYKP